MLRYVQRVDLKATRSEVIERIRDSLAVAGWVRRGLEQRSNGKFLSEYRDNKRPIIARRDRFNACVYVLRVDAPDRWALLTVLSQKQVATLKP